MTTTINRLNIREVAMVVTPDYDAMLAALPALSSEQLLDLSARAEALARRRIAERQAAEQAALDAAAQGLIDAGKAAAGQDQEDRGASQKPPKQKGVWYEDRFIKSDGKRYGKYRYRCYYTGHGKNRVKHSDYMGKID